MMYRKFFILAVSIAMLIGACSAPALFARPKQSPPVETPVNTPAAVQLPESAPEKIPEETQLLREMIVEDVSVEIGVGSPIPVTVTVSGTWPGLCGQLAEIRQQAGETSFDLRLLATPDGPDCPPDHLGLPFKIEIPLNMVEKPFGTYTVTANGVQTTFDWVEVAVEEAPVDDRFVFEGVRIALDPAVASGAFGELIAENAGSADGPYWEVAPEHVRIALDGYPLKQTFHQPVMYVYPVEGFRNLNTPAGEMIQEFSGQLASRPSDPLQMPFLPIVNAGRVFSSNTRYIEFKNGSGVRYLTELAQYVAPINNKDLFYTFQGLTSDGKFYVSIILPVGHPSLLASADDLSAEEFEAIANDPSYYSRMAEELSAQPDESFVPDLAKLDAMIASLEIAR